MLVITPIAGLPSRKDPSLSSASVTNTSPEPARAPLPVSFGSPPIT
jgi:hypothetical protein